MFIKWKINSCNYFNNHCNFIFFCLKASRWNSLEDLQILDSIWTSGLCPSVSSMDNSYKRKVNEIKIKFMIWFFLVFEDSQLYHVHCKMTLKFNNYLLIYANCNTVLCGNRCFQNFPNKSETLWPLRKRKRKISTGKKRSSRGITC